MIDHELVYVPRAVHAKYAQMPYADLVAAAKRGDDGMFLTSAKNYGGSYWRKADKGGVLESQGNTSLYFQGWI